MEDTATVSRDSDFIKAVLEGGPASIPEALRLQTINPREEKIKIPYYGGYEHFERTNGDGPDSAGHVVFRWTMRTEVAE
jgi:hypothetical protein